MNINYLYQQIEDQDEQIDKATKVIETLTQQLEQQQKDIIKYKYENEFLNSQNKLLEKEKIALQKEMNTLNTAKKCEMKQKQININQKEKYEKYHNLWAEQELNYTNTIQQLNDLINQQNQEIQEKQSNLDLLYQQGQQQQLAINQVMEILEQKEQELVQLNHLLTDQRVTQDDFDAKYKQEIDNLKRFTENLFVQSDKQIIMQVNKGKVLKNGHSPGKLKQYKEEQIDESHIYDIILKQGKYINQIYQKLQEKLSNEQLSEFIVEINYIRQQNDIMSQKLEDFNIERNALFQAYSHLIQQSKTQQSYIEQLMTMIKNYATFCDNLHNEEYPQLDSKLLDPLNKNLQQFFQTFQNKIASQQDTIKGQTQQNQKLQQKLDSMQILQSQQQQQSQQLVSLLQQNPKKSSKKGSTSQKLEMLERENQLLIDQLNELSREHEETVKMLEKAVTQLELSSKNDQGQSTKLIESQIDRFLESCSLMTPLQQQQDSIVQKTNILIDLVTMLTDSQHDVLSKLLVTFLVTRENQNLQSFEKDFQDLKATRHNLGILDYLDKLEGLKNRLLGIVEKELKCEYAIPYGKSILIQVLNQIAQRYMDIVQRDTQLIEAQMKKHKNHIIIYKMYKLWKECILDFSEIIFEIIESIDCIGQPQFESKLNQQMQKLNYNFINNFNE